MAKKGSSPSPRHAKAVYVEGVGWRREAGHAFSRRDNSNDYRDGGTTYMLTLTVEEDAPLFGQVCGSLDGYDAAAPLHCYSPDGQPSPLAGPHVSLTALGSAVLRSWLMLKERYGGSVTINPDECVVMPEHFHGIIHINSGAEHHLSFYEKMFKGSCNTAYRLLLAQGKTTAVGTARQWQAAFLAASPAQRSEMTQWLEKSYQRSMERCSSTWSKNTGEGNAHEDIGAPPFRVSTAGEKGKVGFLFRPNYNDKYACSKAKLDEKRRYIRNNPRTRLMRMSHRDRQTVGRMSIDTGLSLSALHGYLKKECGALATPERLAALDSQLLVQYSSTWSKNTIHLDYYGEPAILSAPQLLPVVCHRNDSPIFDKQSSLLLRAAKEESAVLVSARIAKGEQSIMDEALMAACPIVRILLEGFPEKYHPSAEIKEHCAAGTILLVSPWQWSYRYSGDKIDTVLCKTLNCIAQSLCRKKDSFWKENTCSSTWSKNTI